MKPRYRTYRPVVVINARVDHPNLCALAEDAESMDPINTGHAVNIIVVRRRIVRKRLCRIVWWLLLQMDFGAPPNFGNRLNGLQGFDVVICSLDGNAREDFRAERLENS
jgi:hypothetical protein